MLIIVQHQHADAVALGRLDQIHLAQELIGEIECPAPCGTEHWTG